MSRSSLRKFNPLPPDHPLIGQQCPGCKSPFIVGDITTLITIGPGNDPEQQKRARNNQPYTAVAIPAHWKCALLLR
jgi:hypothetical protein